MALGAAKVAVTDCAVLSVTWQVEVVFVHAPDQPVKVDPLAGVSVSVTVAFW